MTPPISHTLPFLPAKAPSQHELRHAEGPARAHGPEQVPAADQRKSHSSSSQSSLEQSSGLPSGKAHDLEDYIRRPVASKAPAPPGDRSLTDRAIGIYDMFGNRVIEDERRQLVRANERIRAWLAAVDAGAPSGAAEQAAPTTAAVAKGPLPLQSSQAAAGNQPGLPRPLYGPIRSDAAREAAELAAPHPVPATEGLAPAGPQERVSERFVAPAPPAEGMGQSPAEPGQLRSRWRDAVAAAHPAVQGQSWLDSWPDARALLRPSRATGTDARRPSTGDQAQGLPYSSAEQSTTISDRSPSPPHASSWPPNTARSTGGGAAPGRNGSLRRSHHHGLNSGHFARLQLGTGSSNKRSSLAISDPLPDFGFSGTSVETPSSWEQRSPHLLPALAFETFSPGPAGGAGADKARSIELSPVPSLQLAASGSQVRHRAPQS